MNSLDWCEACTTLRGTPGKAVPRKGTWALMMGAEVKLCDPCFKALAASGEDVERFEA